jgi:hypothetical protein
MTNLGEYAGVIKQSKITEVWGKCLPMEVVIENGLTMKMSHVLTQADTKQTYRKCH